MTVKTVFSAVDPARVELENIDPLLAEDAEKPVLGHVGNQGLDLVHRKVAREGEAQTQGIAVRVGHCRWAACGAPRQPMERKAF